MITEKSLHDLEWARLVEAIVSRCRGPRAHDPSLPLAETADGARTALAETREAMSLLASGDPLPLDGIRDVREHVARVSRMGVLEGAALRDLTVTLAAARSLRRFLTSRREVAPALFAACPIDPGLDSLHDELAASVDTDGALFDHASADLRKLRTETANLRARLVSKLTQLVHDRAELLSDEFFTQREGRYVIPVRRDAHERVDGIVHGTSASGATVFVEPQDIVVHGNRLRMALAEQEREEARIFAVLSDLVRERLPTLTVAVDALDHADLRAAMARFGHDVRARILPLADAPVIKLDRARHPLLALDGAKVVPNDLALTHGRGLVISGPNAGGKTVALKTMGLAALMMRAGLPIIADEDSTVGFFDRVLTDVGDDQSLVKNLSTFSAHVTNLASILREARYASLVLLDELAGGTDPEEGAALACGVIDALCRAGAAVAVTTHYEPLKAMASRDERLRNAAVGFDVEQMLPTFELALDVPGASSALAVAARFGIPSSVIEFANLVLPEQSRTFDELVRKLEAQRQALATERATAETLRREATALHQDAETRLAQIRAREQERIGKEAQKLLEALRNARDELRTARKSLREAKTDAQLEAARKKLEEAARLAEEAKPKEPVSAHAGTAPAHVEIGDKLYVPRLKLECEVVEAPVRGKVRVAAGPMKLWVDVVDVRAVGTRTEAPAPPVREPAPRKTRTIQTTDNTLDVRGLRVDDAVSMVETFLDRLFGESEPVAYIQHGVGTGALRDAVRELLSRSPRYVDAYRDGSAEEGGSRITVVTLR